jgi:hypothetical protein
MPVGGERRNGLGEEEEEEEEWAVPRKRRRAKWTNMGSICKLLFYWALTPSTVR